MTQTSGKTGPVVGVRVEEEGLQGACGGGVMSHPLFQAVEAQSSGGPSRELIIPSVIIRNGRQAGSGSTSRMI